jgi:hypothetical protein
LPLQISNLFLLLANLFFLLANLFLLLLNLLFQFLNLFAQTFQLSLQRLRSVFGPTRLMREPMKAGAANFSRNSSADSRNHPP